MPASAQKAAGPMDTMREGFWPPYRQERRDDGIREGYAHTNLWHPVIDQEILLSQYTDMLSVGVHVMRGWGKKPRASTRKSQDAARAAATRADHRRMGPSPAGDAIRRPWWDDPFHTDHTCRESGC